MYSTIHSLTQSVSVIAPEWVQITVICIPDRLSIVDKYVQVALNKLHLLK